jgi:large subunit ribosomal protein L13
MNKTYVPTKDSLEHKWYVVDAADQRLGRLATEVAMYLRGKHKPTYTPSMDTGDFVIVINADKIAVTGKKRTQKIYRRHSGRPGGMKTETFAKLQAHTSLGRQLFTKLKVYAGPNHPHQAQQPEELIVHTIPGGHE